MSDDIYYSLCKTEGSNIPEHRSLRVWTRQKFSRTFLNLPGAVALNQLRHDRGRLPVTAWLLRLLLVSRSLLHVLMEASGVTSDREADALLV